MSFLGYLTDRGSNSNSDPARHPRRLERTAARIERETPPPPNKESSRRQETD